MPIRYALPCAVLFALAGCSGAQPPAREGATWTLLDTCWSYVERKACPDARGPDLERCMSAVVEQFNGQRDAEGQRALVVQKGCPTFVAGEKP